MNSKYNKTEPGFQPARKTIEFKAASGLGSIFGRILEGVFRKVLAEMAYAMATRKISVVVPTYNEEKYVVRTLEQVRRVLPASELIVADDKSTDATPFLASQYADAVVTSGLHRIGANRNVGARNTSENSEMLLFVDADTVLSEEFVRKAVEKFQDPEVVGVGCLVMPETRNPVEELFFFILNSFVLFAKALGKTYLAGNCVAYRRNTFFEIGGFDEKTAAGEDMDLSRRISKVGRVVLLPVIVRTSRRRLEKLGFLGLIKDWLRTTQDLLFHKPTAQYAAYR